MGDRKVSRDDYPGDNRESTEERNFFGNKTTDTASMAGIIAQRE